ncbi:uncharacterized protein LOC127755701 [Oryza glaberrima]|uniref:uncharacterized protein LOC127755701 n=1 Tax=Oryza glaberrima TaxID=4538 RepID=UPI00224C3927|nr:uncharacterized protein LOC127755701 [Oryza glaberrima]
MADRAWVNKERYRASYIEGIDIFMKAAKKNVASKKTKYIRCPCVHCKNQKSWNDPSVIEQHLVTHGFVEGYTNWSHHGEIPSKQVPNQATVHDEVLSWDEDVIVVAKEEEEEEEEQVHAVEPVDDDDVVGGNGQHSTVDDADDGNVSVDDGNFADLEEMLRHAEPEVVAGSARGLDNFDALKKAANDLLYDDAKGCEKDFTLLWTIHACVNHCILFRKEYEDLDRCRTCKSSRYKTSRSQSESLDVALDDVEESDPCKDSNKKKIPQLVMWYLPVKDHLKRLFSNPRDAELMRWHHEKRKKDGMIRHPADARQWKEFDREYHKFAEDPRNVRKYILLTILVQGPRQPSNDMDVFLEPLLEDMRDLWEHGIRVWDEFLREYFTLHAIIFVTVNDLTALFSLLGQIKGKTGCVICVDGTVYRYLKGSKKLVYMRHRRFLRKNHSYRSQAKYFDSTVEKGVAPEPWKGDKVFRMTKNLKVGFGKVKKKETNKRKRNDAEVPASPSVPFKKHSIFFKYLPYWKDLDIRHSIDVMHLEKNVFDNTIGTILDILTKTKDGLKSRKYLVDMQIRKELHPVDKGYNSHDCHVMLTVFLAIAIRAVEPVHVKLVITKLCYFFNSISQKLIDPEELGPLRTFAIQTVCELEMCFPPSFFDMMPFERYMSILKGCVWNRAHPEGSMIEGYTTEEVVECCIDYLKDGKAIGLPVPRHEGRLSGKGTKGKKRIHDNDYKKVKDAHFTVLQQLAIVEPYYCCEFLRVNGKYCANYNELPKFPRSARELNDSSIQNIQAVMVFVAVSESELIPSGGDGQSRR